MAQQRTPQSWYQRILKIEPGVSLGQWAVDRVASNWAALVAIFGFGGGGMSFAAVTEPLQHWSPLSWFVIGVASAIAGGLFFAIAAWTRERFARYRIWQAAATRPSRINPLAGEFTRETISIAELMNPMGLPTAEKHFIECDFMGPGLVVISACFVGMPLQFGNVEFVQIPDRYPAKAMPNKLWLDRCQIHRCRFWNLIIAVTPDTAETIRQTTKNTRWLTGQSNEPQASPQTGEA
jgi:hypothetical protein